MEQYINYRFKNLLNVGEDNKHRYLSSNPFPNIVLKDFFNPEISTLLDYCYKESHSDLSFTEYEQLKNKRSQ